MELSKRFSQLQPSPTLALDAKAKQMAAAGTKVINFSVGEPDFPTPQVIVDAAIAGLNAGHTRYGPSGGSPKLRQAIAAKLAKENSLQFTADEIVVGMGAKEILFHLFLALLEEGDEVLIPAPYWVSYTTHAQACGAKAVVIPMANDPGGPRLTPEMIAPHLTPRTKLILLNSPNNPGGYILKRAELEALGQYLASKKIWVIADEIYEYLAYDAPHDSLLALTPALRDRFILVNGLSKGFAMTGWRVGYCAAPPPVAKVVRTLESQTSTCVPGFIEDAALVAIQSGKELMAPSIKLLKDRRDLALNLVKEHIPNLPYLKPEGAFYLYMDIRPFLAASADFGPDNSIAFSEKLLTDYHVAIVPGEAFGTKGFLRLSYAVNNEDLKAGIIKIGEALRRISGNR